MRLLLVALIACNHDLPAPEAANPIDAIVNDAISRDHLVGVSVAVVKADTVVYAHGYGFADAEQHVPVTPETRFRLASISKLFTATAAWKLVEAGVLDLDKPVQTYVPSFPVKQWPVTSRELLAHTSGIRHYKGAAEMISAKHYTDLVTPLEIFEADPLLFEPNTKMAYSSYAYNLLGEIVEASGREPYAAQVQHIFDAAGMTGAKVEDATTPRAVGYTSSQTRAPAYDVSNKIPSGGFIATATDLAKLAIAFDQHRLVKPETFAQMSSPQRTSTGALTTFGLGFQLTSFEGMPVVFHSGGQPGVSDIAVMIPSRNVAVVILTNDSGVKDILKIAEAIAQLELD
jgi:serine beta-lactamase-like protein LACTB, mitochondrial